MPAGKFLDHLTAQETQELKNLPTWNGSNEWQITGTVLAVAEKAIARFKHLPLYADGCGRRFESIKNGVVSLDDGER